MTDYKGHGAWLIFITNSFLVLTHASVLDVDANTYENTAQMQHCALLLQPRADEIIDSHIKSTEGVRAHSYLLLQKIELDGALVTVSHHGGRSSFRWSRD